MKKVLAVILVVVLTGCSLLFPPSLEDEIVGRWQSNATPSYYLTFEANGDLHNSDNESGTWAIVNDSLVVEWTAGWGFTYELSFDGDNMTIVSMFGAVTFTRAD